MPLLSSLKKNRQLSESGCKLLDQFIASLRPPVVESTSDWADEHRVLSPEASAEPGPWRTERAPYLRGIMDAADDPAVREIWWMKSAQVGATECLNNILGKRIHRSPGPILVVQPTLEMAEAWSKDRLATMIRDTPVLSELISPAEARKTDNTILYKRFPGGHITIGGANSPAGLASRPIRDVLYDEIDRFPASAGSEGDPISLARKRTTTFWNRFIYGCSTPTIDGASRIQTAFEGGDQRYYHVPCPHCGEFQRLKWSNVKWPEGEPDRAAYVCEVCAALITDADKPEMLRKGEWIAEKPFDGIASFHISELYSPWVRFSELVRAFLEAKRSPETLQTWINTSLGETWKVRGEAPSWERVAALRMDYESGSVPVGVWKLVAGVDVQKNRLVYGVRGFGRNMSSWLVEHGELWGDTQQAEVWHKLAALLAERWGDDMGIEMMLIDSGYLPDKVYEFCRRYPQARPTKGRDAQAAYIMPSRLDYTRNGVRVKSGIQLWHIHTDYFKTWVHNRIEWPADEDGAWLLNADTTESYCRQIVAESRLIGPTGKVTWIQEDRDNHYFDVEVLCAAGAHMLQIHRMNIPKVPATAPVSAPVRTRRETADDNWINIDPRDKWV